MPLASTELYEALRAIGVPDTQALRAAEAAAMPNRDIADLRADLAAVRHEMSAMRQELKAEIAETRHSLELKIESVHSELKPLKWGVGLVVGGIVSLILKAFVFP